MATTNQIAIANLEETQRHNLAGEDLGNRTLAENTRHNIAGETENNRHNVETEQENHRHNIQGEAETHRSNVKNEYLKEQQNIETHRTNVRHEELESEKNAETKRNNMEVSTEKHRSNVRGEELRLLETAAKSDRGLKTALTFPGGIADKKAIDYDSIIDEVKTKLDTNSAKYEANVQAAYERGEIANPNDPIERMIANVDSIKRLSPEQVKQLKAEMKARELKEKKATKR